MKRFTINDIEGWDVGYAAKEYLPKDWSGTVMDLLNRSELTFTDRLKTIMRPELVSEKLMRRFSIWCAKQVEKEITDPRCISAIKVAEEYLEGRVPEEVLAITHQVALDAGRAAPLETALAHMVAAATVHPLAADSALVASIALTRAIAKSGFWYEKAAVKAAQSAKLRELLQDGRSEGDVF